MNNTLDGQVAVVTGATRGAGRGIAVELGAAGATVYCTGRSVRGEASPSGKPETIDETAEMVSARGGAGIAVRVDHTKPEQVEPLFARIRAEHDGRLDILVNNVWGGDALSEWGKPFWEHSLANGLQLLEQAFEAHLIASHFAAPLLIAAGRGLIATTVDAECGPLYWNLAKNGAERMTQLMAEDLRPHNVAVVALGPGFMRTEALLRENGVTEENWKTCLGLNGTETPYFVGRALVALATAPDFMTKTGKGVSSGDLADEYGLTDVDGTRPHWGRFWKQTHPD